jgi:putative lipoic acid-binding regulatory protein
VIGTDKDLIKTGILAILGEEDYKDPYDISFSNKSRRGSYVSINLKLRIYSESQRTGFYSKLKSISGVKIIL